MGGEKTLWAGTNRAPLGSPPRRRGKADKDDVSGLDLGITPAGAGKSGAGYADKGRPGDHPRMGGEKAVAIIW